MAMLKRRAIARMGRRYDDYSNSRSGYSTYDDFATMDDRWLMMQVRNHLQVVHVWRLYLL